MPYLHPMLVDVFGENENRCFGSMSKREMSMVAFFFRIVSFSFHVD